MKALWFSMAALVIVGGCSPDESLGYPRGYFAGDKAFRTHSFTTLELPAGAANPALVNVQFKPSADFLDELRGSEPVNWSLYVAWLLATPVPTGCEASADALMSVENWSANLPASVPSNTEGDPTTFWLSGPTECTTPGGTCLVEASVLLDRDLAECASYDLSVSAQMGAPESGLLNEEHDGQLVVALETP